MVTLFQAPTWAKSAGFQKSLPSDGQLFSGKYHPFLYNKLSCACILIGSHLWSIGGQTYRWRHQWHTAAPRLSLFCSYRSFDVICNLLLNRRSATWNLFAKYISRGPTYSLLIKNRDINKLHWRIRTGVTWNKNSFLQKASVLFVANTKF